MRGQMKKKLIGLALSLVAACFMWSGTALGLTIDLVAEPATVTMPDATVVDMWGFRNTGDTSHAAGDWKVPVFTTNDADTLTINLTNSLPADTASTLKKPVSVIIPGLLGTGTTPVWIDGATGTTGTSSASRPTATHRVRSLTDETANGAGAPGVYQWNSLKAGTYIIQSGTHQQVQVQMGLYAVLVVTPAGSPGQAYDATATVTSGALTYASEQVLAFSEVDTALHAAVVADQYGPGKTYTSTMNFHPDYYLVNGMPFSAGAAALNIGTANDNILIRLVNAGYETVVPVFQGEYVNLIAEDGNVLPYTQELYSVELTAGKTKDVILATPQSESITVYDGRLALTNGGVSGGGAMVKLAATPQGGVLSPNGGEVFNAGDNVTITWASNPGATTYDVRLSFNGGTSFWNLANGVAGTSQAWVVPNNSVTNGVVRVVSRNGGAWVGSDDSDAPFSVTKGGTVLFPNGGESLAGNSAQSIQWTTYPGAATYDVRLSFNGGASFWTIASGVAATNFAWTVPNNNVASAVVKVVAKSGGGGWLAADDSNSFSIVKQ